MTSTPTDVWRSLFERTPFPYSTPLPPPEPSPLDGTYVKFDQKVATPVPCRRCPDYAPEGGWWWLSLDRGIFRLLHTVTGWKSVASFIVSGDRLTLFSDPYCPYEAGVYRWALAEGQLHLTAVDDPCAIKLRALNLTSLPWSACQPPRGEAALADAWLAPPGCPVEAAP